MVLLSCSINIKSELCLEDVASIISYHLFGGVEFAGRSDYVRDEIPAVYTNYILGCRFLLSGEPDAEGYTLEVAHREWPTLKGLSAQQIKESVVDISADLAERLKSVGSIQARLVR